MVYKKVAIFGVGLVGGSIGLALKERKLTEEVIGVSRRLETLKKARALKLIDSYTLDPKEAFSGADLIVLAAPPAAVIGLLKTGLDFLEGRYIITDACSTKKKIVSAADDFLPETIFFVGGHPIAGSEKSGPEAATADLFEDRVTILTPTSKTDPAALETVRKLWENLGSRVFLLSPSEHDRILAATSHVPHLLAVIATLLLKRSPFAEKREFVGTGFRDVSRTAAGEPSVWKEVFLTNADNIRKDLTSLERLLAEWKEALERGDGDYIQNVLEEASGFRKTLFSDEEGKE